MGRPSGQGKPKRLKWSIDETVNLLGHLDNFLRTTHFGGRPVEKPLFKQGNKTTEKLDVLQHLQRCLPSRSEAQIKAKLNKVCQDWGDPSAITTVDYLLKSGTASLRILDDDVRHGLENITEALHVEYLNTPRKTRSGSRSLKANSTPRDSIVRDTSTVDNRAASVPSTRRLSQAARSTKVKHDLRSSLSQSPLPQTISAIKSLKNSTSLQNVASSPPSIPEVADSFDSNWNSRSTSLERDKSSKSRTHGEKRSYESYLKESSRLPIFDYNEDRLNGWQSFELLLHSIHDSRQVLENLWKDNSYLFEKLRDLEVQHDRSDHAKRYQENNEVERLIEERNQLKFRIKSMQTKPGLAWSASNSSFSYRTIEEIRTLFDKIRQCCIVISRKNDFYAPSQVPSSEDLRKLFHAAAGTSQLNLASLVTCSQPYNRVSTEQLIHSIIGISVQEWVLKPDLQSMAMLNTPFLERFKDQIRVLAGSRHLRSIEASATRELIEDRHFRNTFLSGATKGLADRMWEVISFFLVESNNAKTKKRIRDQLEEVYHHAFEIKFWTLCCEELFDTIWPPADSRVQSNLATLERSELPQDESMVNLPLVPGLQRYEWNEGLAGISSFKLDDKKEFLKEPQVVYRAIIAVLE